MPEAASELEEDLTGLLDALARIFDPGTFFHQHNKNQDAVGGKVSLFTCSAQEYIADAPRISQACSASLISTTLLDEVDSLKCRIQ